MASPPHFYRLAGKFVPWLGGLAVLLLAYGLYGGLVKAPPDYQMGDGFRIIYVHVPAAVLSLFVYVVMASAAAIGLIWRIKLAHAVAASCAPIGAWFTFLALLTGAIWGKPMWGTWWVWDARLTSELVLLFLYLGYIALHAAIDDTGRADRAAGLLAIVGVVNVPIIHYSVEWWTTLHQPATITKLGPSSIESTMKVPLWIMIFGFMAYFAAVMLMRARGEVIEREWHKKWVREKIGES
ncbi:MAG: heme ABC transporter permease [Gammaproteobacteria bacterium]|nr:heme ABC transporter permease [Gammaproteobacteria bacterium]